MKKGKIFFENKYREITSSYHRIPSSYREMKKGKTNNDSEGKMPLSFGGEGRGKPYRLPVNNPLFTMGLRVTRIVKKCLFIGDFDFVATPGLVVKSVSAKPEILRLQLSQ